MSKDSTSCMRGFFFKASLLFLFIHGVFLVFCWKFYPTELDTPYHLLIAKMFWQKGGISFWDSLSFAPFGRPHLYPPLLHLLLWFLKSLTSLSFLDTGRVFVLAQTMGTLFCVWFFCRRLFGEASAFFSLLLFASNTQMWWWQTSVSPAAVFPLVLFPSLWFFYKKKYIFCMIFLSASFYLHWGLALILCSIILVASCADKAWRSLYMKRAFLVALGSFLTFGPWLVHLLRWRGYLAAQGTAGDNDILFSFFIPWQEFWFYFNGLFWFFAFWGFLACLRRRRDDFKYLLFAAAGAVGCVVYLLIYSGTRFSAHAPVFAVLLAGFGAGRVWQRIRLVDNSGLRYAARFIFSFLLMICVFFEPHFLSAQSLINNSVNASLMGLSSAQVLARPAPLLNEARSLFLQVPLAGKHRIRVQDFFSSARIARLLEFLDNNVPREEILHLDNEALASYITLQTGLLTDTGMFWESVTSDMLKKRTQKRNRGFFISLRRDFRGLAGEGIDLIPYVIADIDGYYVARY